MRAKHIYIEVDKNAYIFAVFYVRFFTDQSSPRVKLRTDLTIVSTDFVMLWICRSIPPTNPNLFPYVCLSRSRYCLSLFISLVLCSSTTALRKLINPARNCENTQTFRVENDRSNRTFGTRLSQISQIYAHAHAHTHIHTHTKRDANLQL